MYQLEESPKPFIVIDMDGFIYQYTNSPYKLKETAELLLEAMRTGAKLLLLTENKAELKTDLLNGYGPQANCFLKYIVETKKQERIKTVKDKLKAFITHTPNNLRRTSTGSRIVLNQQETNVYLVIYYAKWDENEYKSVNVSNECRLILIDQEDERHLASLKTFVTQFNKMKAKRDAAQEEQFKLLTHELINGQTYLKLTRDCEYQRAEIAVLGNIAYFLKEQKANVASEKNFNAELPKTSMRLTIGSIFNGWDIYACLVDELVSVKPDLFSSTDLIRSRLHNHFGRLKKDEKEKEQIKAEFGNAFYDRLMQFCDFESPDNIRNCANDKNKLAEWEQLIVDLKRSININSIKKEMLKYINELDKGKNKNWIKKKLDEDNYNSFIKFLSCTVDDIAQLNIDEGEGNWIRWNQLEIDCVIIREIYSKLTQRNIIFYIIQYTDITKVNIETEDKQEEVPLFGNRTTPVPYKVRTVAYDGSEENIEHIVINKEGINKINLQTKQFDLGKESQLIALGVHQKVTKNNEIDRTSKQSVIYRQSQFVYTTFIASPQQVLNKVPDYNAILTKLMTLLNSHIVSSIKEYAENYKLMFKKPRTFPVPVSQTPVEKLSMELIDPTNINSEVQRLVNYLNKQVTTPINDCFNSKKHLYKDAAQWCQAGLIYIESLIDNITCDCDRNINRIHNAREAWMTNSKLIEARKKTPAYSLTSSHIDLASAVNQESNQPVFEMSNVYTAARFASLAVFKVYLEQEKISLGNRFHIDRSTEGCRDIEAYIESPEHLVDMDQNNQLLRGRNLLQNATNRGNAAVVEHLLFVEKADANYRSTPTDLPPLFDWVRHLSRKSLGEGPHILELLLRAKANPNLVSQNLDAMPGGTFIHYIADLGHFWTMEIVLQNVLSKGGNCKINLFKKTEGNFLGNWSMPKTAMLYAATHDNFRIANGDEPSDHFKLILEFFKSGFVFSSDELEYLYKIYAHDDVVMDLLRKICEINLKKYNDIINELTETPVNSNAKAGSTLLKDFFQAVDEDSDNINLGLVKSEVDQWLFKLGLKIAPPPSPPETVAPQSARSLSSTALKPTLTRSNSVILVPPPSTASSPPSSTHSISLKKKFFGIFSSKDTTDVTHTEDASPRSKKAGSDIVSHQGRNRADSMRETDNQKSGSEIRVPNNALLNANSLEELLVLRGRSETAAARLNIEQEKITLLANPDEITTSFFVTLDKLTGLAMVHNICIVGEIPLFYYLINKEESEQANLELEREKEMLKQKALAEAEKTKTDEKKENVSKITLQNGETEKKKSIRKYKLLSVCSSKLRVPLYYAVKFNHFDFVYKLFELEAPLMPDAALLNDCCKTPLHAAIENLKVAIENKDEKMINDIKKLIEKILEYAVKTETFSCIMNKDKNKHTPLIKAAIFEMEDVVKMIIGTRIWHSQFDQQQILSEIAIPNRNKRKKIFECIRNVYVRHFQNFVPTPAVVASPRKHS